MPLEINSGDKYSPCFWPWTKPWIPHRQLFQTHVNHNRPGYDLPIRLVLLTLMERVLVNKNLFMFLLFHLAYTTLRSGSFFQRTIKLGEERKGRGALMGFLSGRVRRRFWHQTPHSSSQHIPGIASSPQDNSSPRPFLKTRDGRRFSLGRIAGFFHTRRSV